MNENTLTFYEGIADDYDTLLTSNLKDIESRKNIKNYVCNIPEISKIIDFGAGTGLDLKWQLNQGYEILFYEPSEAMAKKAMARVKNHEGEARVKFITGHQATLKILENEIHQSTKVDAIFSNFAVLNSILEVGSIFKVFSNLIKPLGHIFCVLHFPKYNFIHNVKALLKIPRTITISSSSGNKMKTFLHDKRDIKKAALQNGLVLNHSEKVIGSEFVLYHLNLSQ